MNNIVRIKWAGPNTPMIKVFEGDKRLYLNKKELVALRDEINEFIAYYKEDFSKNRIDIIDNEGDVFGE